MQADFETLPGLHPSRHKTSFQRLFEVHTTSPASYRRLIDVETTSCVYWDTIQFAAGVKIY